MQAEQLQALLDALTGDFRALSIWPEWIYAFCFLNKRIENRGPKVAQTARRFIGHWVALHGSKNIGGDPPVRGEWREYPHGKSIREMAAIAESAGVEPPPFKMVDDILACRGIRALGYLSEVLPPPRQRSGYHMPDCYGLRFSEVIVLPTAVEAKGALGFWRVPDEVKAEIKNRLLATKQV